MNKKVLIVCYYFPPLGMAGIGRPLSLFKKLPALGYDCDVLTVKPVAYWGYEPDLLEGIDTSRVFRSGSHDPQRLMYLLGMRQLRRSVAGPASRAAGRFFPDSKIGWVRAAVRLGRTLVENYRYDVILSTSPPMSAHLVARKLAREFKLPWVADFRDFWTSYRVEEVFDRPRLIRKGRRLLKEIVSQAAAVTAVNKDVARYLGAGEVIPNGFDERVEDWRLPPNSDRYVIGVPGAVNRPEGLKPLLDLLDDLQQDDATLFEHIRLMQLGAVHSDWLNDLLEQHGLGDRSDILGYQPRSECIKALSAASMFYLDVPESLGTETVPSRVFELLVSGRPLLAQTPLSGGLCQLIEKHNAGLCFDHLDRARALDYLKLQVTDHRAGTAVVNPLPKFSHEYSADAMAAKVARVLDRL